MSEEHILNEDVDNQTNIDLFRVQLFRILETLTEREQKILDLRYGIKEGQRHTQKEVGEMFNVSIERVREVEQKALRKLRHPSRFQRIKNCIDDYFDIADVLKQLSDRSLIVNDRIRNLCPQVYFNVSYESSHSYFDDNVFEDSVFLDTLETVETKGENIIDAYDMETNEIIASVSLVGVERDNFTKRIQVKLEQRCNRKKSLTKILIKDIVINNQSQNFSKYIWSSEDSAYLRNQYADIKGFRYDEIKRVSFAVVIEIDGRNGSRVFNSKIVHLKYNEKDAIFVIVGIEEACEERIGYNENGVAGIITKDTLIYKLGFSSKVYNSLSSQGIKNVRDLCNITLNDLTTMRNMDGEGCVEVLDLLKKLCVVSYRRPEIEIDDMMV